jgi:predicted molibdopterin-dependent oxidoreductase YjgC
MIHATERLTVEHLTVERYVEAMGTRAHIIVVDGPASLANEAAARIRELEAKWSRFIEDSELCRLNRQPGRVVKVSAETYLLVSRAIEAWGLTDGGWCDMSSPRGRVKIKVQATDRSPRGTVFTSFSFGDVPVNVLTGSGYDPITQTAELKVCPVRIEPA